MRHMTIIDDIASYPSDGRFYLMEEITNRSGFFVTNGQLVYGVTTTTVGVVAPVRTASLEFDAGIKLLPVKIGEDTEPQVFDLIRMISSPTDREAEAFITLCRDHALGNSPLSLRDFFFAASKLFRQEALQGKRKAIGLFGELSVIRIAKSLGIDLSCFWQRIGGSSKYDFAMPGTNIEVKTTTRREMVAKVKHEQLFNDDQNYLVFCRAEKSPAGQTVRDFAKELIEIYGCFSSLESRLALAGELLTIDDAELDVPYRLNSYDVYDCREINPIRCVPERVTSISYDLDLTGLQTVSLVDVLSSKDVVYG